MPGSARLFRLTSVLACARLDLKAHTRPLSVKASGSRRARAPIPTALQTWLPFYGGGGTPQGFWTLSSPENPPRVLQAACPTQQLTCERVGAGLLDPELSPPTGVMAAWGVRAASPSRPRARLGKHRGPDLQYRPCGRLTFLVCLLGRSPG